MKAVVYTKYGSPDVLEYKDVEKPKPKDDEVLVKIKATSINSWDWDMLTGKPRIYRLISGIRKPKYNIMGIDIAGKVEAVGKMVKSFKVGDEVFGDISGSGFGAYAEYTCAHEKFLALKPRNASFEEAAAIPHGGVMALQGVNTNGAILPRQEVLINGAGGSTGTIALQLAKLNGAIVTCVDTEQKFELLRSMGADHVIDYKKEDYTKNGKQYNLIIDLMAHRSVFAYKRALAPNGAFTMVGGAVRRMFQTAIIGSLISKFSNKKLGLLIHNPCRENLEKLKELFEEGKIKSVIDQTYSLKEIPTALQRLGEGGALGKLIIRINQNTD
jgi:NADPH:quinone reductase-like Zn-dependent oxidoreductase